MSQIQLPLKKPAAQPQLALNDQKATKGAKRKQRIADLLGAMKEQIRRSK